MTLPFASVILLTYNQEHFVEEAFLSLLNQDTDNIEIIVSDDSSSDDTWGKIQKVASEYQGPKKIILARNPTNVGIVTNYAKAFEKSSGELIFMAAGDDISLPERCSQSIRFWMDGRQKYDLVAADALDMAYDGKNLGPKQSENLETWTVKKWFERRPFFFGASHMVTKRLLNLAPLDSQLPYEDQCLVFRAILMGGAIRLPTPLVCHRRGGMTQASEFQFGHRRAEIARDMAREIVELKQFLSDATALGKRAIVEDLVVKKTAFCSAIFALFQSKFSPKAFWVFWDGADVPVDKKLRYSRYYLFYPFLSLAHGVRDLLRLLRRVLNSRHAG